MNRYVQTFERLAGRGEGAFVPFAVVGDPRPERSVENLSCLAASGADILELGLPFSDPTADGPVIQLANGRALSARRNAGQTWEIIAEVRSRHKDIPIGLLVYANLMESIGAERFFRHAKTSGVDSVLIADLPTIEAAPYLSIARAAGIAPVLIAAPNTPRAHLEVIARESEAFVYLVSRAGVTGTEQVAGMAHLPLLTALRELRAAPALLGFGISTPDHVRQAIATGVQGAISGSAVVRIIEENQQNHAACLEKLAMFCRQMKAATQVSG